MSEDAHNSEYERCHGCNLFMVPKGLLCPNCSNDKKPRHRIFVQPPRVDYVRVFERANCLYNDAKGGGGHVRHKIGDSVLCMGRALVEAINETHDEQPMPGGDFATAELALNVARAKLQQARETIDRTNLEPRLCVEIDNVLLWLGDTALKTVQARSESGVRA